MKRRTVLKRAGALSMAPLIGVPIPARASIPMRRCLPGDPGWPSAEKWEALNQAVGGRLAKIALPMVPCANPADAAACSALFKELKNRTSSATATR
jgi:hypothetical protein